jgi:hypothetical protein
MTEFKILVTGRRGSPAEFNDPQIEVYPSYADALDALLDYHHNRNWQAEPYDPLAEWSDDESVPSAWEQARKLDVDGLFFCTMALCNMP